MRVGVPAMVAVCYHMAVDLHIRAVPDAVHATLVARAAARNMSLRAYVVEVLAEHCATPTVDEWLTAVETLPRAAGSGSAAEALDAERAERDAELAGGDPHRHAS